MRNALIIILSFGLVTWTVNLIRGIQDFQTMIDNPVSVYFAYAGMILFILDQLFDLITRGE
jgi:hypothetical protein